RGGERGQGLELLLDLLGFRRGGVAQDFKRDRFGQVGVRVDNIRQDQLLERLWRTGSGEVDPEAGVDQGGGHQRSQLLAARSAACRSGNRDSSNPFSSTPHSPERNFWASRSRRFIRKASATSFRIAGPFLRSPVIWQISRSSDSAISTVIFILSDYQSRILWSS